MTPVKVTMECTSSGWKVVVYAEERIVWREEFRRSSSHSRGSFTGTVPNNGLENFLPDHPKFLSAMEDLGFAPMDITQALMRVEEGDDEVTAEIMFDEEEA